MLLIYIQLQIFEHLRSGIDTGDIWIIVVEKGRCGFCNILIFDFKIV